MIGSGKLIPYYAPDLQDYIDIERDERKGSHKAFLSRIQSNIIRLSDTHSLWDEVLNESSSNALELLSPRQ